MKPFVLNILLSLSSYAVGKLDEKIDTEIERREMAIKIRDDIEKLIGRDIPLLDDKAEVAKIQKGILLIHQGLSLIKGIVEKED